MDKSLLRRIPKVDELLAPVRALCPDASTAAVTAAVRRTLDALRESVLSGLRKTVAGLSGGDGEKYRHYKAILEELTDDDRS